MQLHPWMIASWPIIERGADPSLAIAGELQHLGTTVSGDCDEFGRFLGHTFWGTAQSKVGVAWDWIEAVDGIFAMLDPMSIVSNIGFVDDTGTGIPEFMKAIQLNRITHAIPWQAEVAKATRAVRAAEPWNTRLRQSFERSKRQTQPPPRRAHDSAAAQSATMGAMR